MGALDAQWYESEPTFEPGDLLNSHGYPTDHAIEKILTFSGSPKEFVEYVNSIWSGGGALIEVMPDKFHEAIVEVHWVTFGCSGNETVISAVEKTMFSFAYWEMSKRGGLFVYHVPLERWDQPWKCLGVPFRKG